MGRKGGIQRTRREGIQRMGNDHRLKGRIGSLRRRSQWRKLKEPVIRRERGCCGSTAVKEGLRTWIRRRRNMRRSENSRHLSPRKGCRRAERERRRRRRQKRRGRG